ncbi:NAD-dependent epimerase/dehydratase family protein [Candidatus Saccharibacteria bacterium]|nr:NAD-dependent epimerase/dehydratase family protein [Candidatus Saccharibacteria bacterium]
MSKIVVFGGDGFIGRHLTSRLASVETNQIVVFDRFSSYQIGENNFFSSHKNIDIVAGNFFNRAEVNQVLSQADIVFHLVSTTNPATSVNDPLIDVDTNIRSSIELFELCVENRVGKIIFLSSGGTVYGQTDSEKIDEETLTQPISPYAIGKLTIEHYLRYFKHHYGLDYLVYRVANPYGPGQNLHGKQGVIPIFLNLAFDKEPITIFGDGNMVRDYLYITDLVDMIVSSYNKNNRYDEYNIGSGRGVTVNELVEIIEKKAGYSLDKKTVDIPDTYVEKIVLDTTRFVSEFKLKPTISLKEGISKTWDYVREKD